MWIRSRAVIALLALAVAAPAAADGINNQFQDGVNGNVANGINVPSTAKPVPVPPPPFSAPTVVANTCTIALPVVNGSPVNLTGGGTCIYTALCNGLSCRGGNAITGWAITAQSCSNCFAIDGAGNLLGGSNAANVQSASTYTVTVTATNPTGTSPPLTQQIIVPPAQMAPTVVANTCVIALPVVNGSPVNLSGGGTCVYTATCGGGACGGGNAVTGWAITASSCLNCFAIDNGGNLRGSTNAASVSAGNVYTVTVTASNATGTSAPLVQNITTPAINCISYSTNLCITWQTGAGNEITWD